MTAVLALAVVLLVSLVSSGSRQRAHLESELSLQREEIAAMQARLADETEKNLIHDSEPVITTSLVSDQLHSLQQLVTAEYFYTNSGKYENQRQITIIGQQLNIPFTKSYFIVAYDGCIKVGVDLGKADIAVDDNARTVTVTLPNSELISHETFEDTLVVLDETSNAFNPISISDYAEFVNAQSSRMEQKAAGNGIYTQAKDEAKALIQSVLSLMPGIGGEDGYRLVVK